MSVCVCGGCESNLVPMSVLQGESKSWTWSLCNYPADEYDLQFRFRGPGTGFDVDAMADGEAYDATHVFGTSLAVGKWIWQAWVTEIATPTNTFVVRSGTLTVEAGFAAAGAGVVETRTKAQIMLDTIDAALLAFATSDVLEYEIQTPAGSRRVKRSDKASLTSQRKYWATVVGVEKTQQRLKNGGSLMRSIPIVVNER